MHTIRTSTQHTICRDHSLPVLATYSYCTYLIPAASPPPLRGGAVTVTVTIPRLAARTTHTHTHSAQHHRHDARLTGTFTTHGSSTQHASETSSTHTRPLTTSHVDRRPLPHLSPHHTCSQPRHPPPDSTQVRGDRYEAPYTAPGALAPLLPHGLTEVTPDRDPLVELRLQELLEPYLLSLQLAR